MNELENTREQCDEIQKGKRAKIEALPDGPAEYPFSLSYGAQGWYRGIYSGAVCLCGSYGTREDILNSFDQKCEVVRTRDSHLGWYVDVEIHKESK